MKQEVNGYAFLPNITLITRIQDVYLLSIQMLKQFSGSLAVKMKVTSELIQYLKKTNQLVDLHYSNITH